MADTFTAADIETVASGDTPTTTTDAPAAASDTTTTAPPEAATSQPAVEVDAINDPGWGQIPQSRRQSILDNARKKARAERETELNQEWESKTGWAKDIDPQEAAIVREWVRRGNTDPVGLVSDLWQRVQNDPTHGTRLRSEAARILGARQGQAQPAEDAMPQPDIPTDTSNGQPVVYSAQQLQKLLEWQDRRSEARLKKELEPYQQDRQTRQQTEELLSMQAQSTDYATKTVTPLTKLPGFEEHKAAIAKEYEAMAIRDPRTGQMVPDPNDPRSEGEKLRDAYLKIVVPTLSSAGRQQAVTDLHRKANANTVNPSATSSTEPFDYKTASWEEGLKHEWNKRKGA